MRVSKAYFICVYIVHTFQLFMYVQTTDKTLTTENSPLY